MNLLTLSASNNGLAKFTEGIEALKRSYKELYRRFDEIVALYVEDLPKSENQKNERGDLEYIIMHGKCFVIESVKVCSFNDIRNNAETLLRILYENGLLNERRYRKLSENPDRAEKILRYVPIEYFDKNLLPILFEELRKDSELNLNLVKVPMREKLEDLIYRLTTEIDNIKVTVYGLMLDGSVGKRIFGKNNIKGIKSYINQAIIVTTNAIGYYGLAFIYGKDVVGLPNQPPRNSYYKKILDKIKEKFQTIEEPVINREPVRGILLKYLQQLGYII